MVRAPAPPGPFPIETWQQIVQLYLGRPLQGSGRKSAWLRRSVSRQRSPFTSGTCSATQHVSAAVDVHHHSGLLIPAPAGFTCASCTEKLQANGFALNRFARWLDHGFERIGLALSNVFKSDHRAR